MEESWADAVMSLKGEPNVVDIRTLGLVGAIDLAPRAEGVGKRAYEAMDGRIGMMGVRRSSQAHPTGTLRASEWVAHRPQAAVASGSSPGLSSHTVRLA